MTDAASLKLHHAANKLKAKQASVIQAASAKGASSGRNTTKPRSRNKVYDELFKDSQQRSNRSGEAQANEKRKNTGGTQSKSQLKKGAGARNQQGTKQAVRQQTGGQRKQQTKATTGYASAHEEARASVQQKASTSGAKKVKKKKRKVKPKRGLFLTLFRLLAVGASVLLCWCLFAYYIIIFNEQEPLTKADAGIILGAALWNNEPSPALKERLDYAVELYEQKLLDYLILSGGKSQGSRGLTEAEGMRDYLLDKGIPEEKLLLEGHSADTYENIVFSKRVMEKAQLNSAMIISHQYHTKRAEDIAKYVDYKHVQTAGVQTKVLNETYHYTREMLAYTKWQLNKLFIPLGIMI